MTRWLLAAWVLFQLGTPSAFGAEQQKGTVRKVDATGKQLTVEVSGANKSYEVASDASIVRQEAGDKKKTAAIRVIEPGLSGVQVGSSIEFLMEELNGKPVITSLKVTAVPKTPDAAAPKTKPTEPKKPVPPSKKKSTKKKDAKSKSSAKK